MDLDLSQITITEEKQPQSVIIFDEMEVKVSQNINRNPLRYSFRKESKKKTFFDDKL